MLYVYGKWNECADFYLVYCLNGIFFFNFLRMCVNWVVGLQRTWMNHLLIVLFDWISIRILRHSHQNYYSYWCLMLHAFITPKEIKRKKKHFWRASHCIQKKETLLDAWIEVSKIHREIIRWVCWEREQ